MTVAVALLGLAACQRPPAVTADGGPPLPRQKPNVPAAQGPATMVDDSPREPKPQRQATVLAPPVPAQPLAPIEQTPLPSFEAQPVTLVGLSQGEIRTLLGDPSDQRDQPPGQFWTYRTDACTLEVIFFLDVSRNGFYALDRRILGNDASEAAVQSCIRRIRDSKHAA